MRKYNLFVVIAILVFGTPILVTPVAAQETIDELSLSLQQTTLDRNEAFIEASLSSLNYYDLYQTYQEDNLPFGTDNYEIFPQDIRGDLVMTDDTYPSGFIPFNSGESIQFSLTVEHAGLYQIYLDYKLSSESTVAPSISVLMDGVAPFSEANNLPLEVEFVSEPIKIDRYGDEITPQSLPKSAWRTNQGVLDPNRFFLDPLLFYLPLGTTTVDVLLNDGSLFLGNIIFKYTNQDLESYKDYYLIDNSPQSLITIEAEDYASKSRQSIRAKYVRDPQVTPYEYQHRVLNVLDGYSFGEMGDSVTYEFDIETTGNYQIALKYLQNMNNGLLSTRDIRIDDQLLFSELEGYQFPYTATWANEVLHGEDPFSILLEKGSHTLSLSVSSTEVATIYHQLLDLLTIISNLSREINRITGGLEDDEREWNIETYIPYLTSDLTFINEQLRLINEQLITIQKRNDLPIINELKIVQELLAYFIQKPNDIPNHMSNFSEGELSAYGRINALLPSLIYNPLQIDKIYIFNDQVLPDANAPIWTKVIEEVKAFFYSFFDPKYNEAAAVDKDTIVLWVNKSRLYVDMMQRMIDEDFSDQTGIKVQLSIMPDENKIILSNAAGTTPDGILGISFQKPFEFALRDMIVNLRELEGFYDLSFEFSPSSFIPYIYEDGVYAIPETQDVKLLFYRKDILGDLNLLPPDTWQDVISMVPVLRKYNMNFYAPIGDENAFKAFDKTAPFIYQFGGTFYNENPLSTAINTGGAYEAFQLMTDLFTIYNLPISTANFFQHFRAGSLPVGIGDANTYIQLRYAAPELSGQWGVLPIPGVENEEGIIERWDPTYGSSSIIFNRSDKIDSTWQLIRWWTSKHVQADFSSLIQSTLGNKFLYMTANLEGFKLSVWPSDTKEVILEQWNWIQTTGKVPGDYMLERELSNAWNKVVINGIHPRIAIDEAKVIIDLEIERKLIEFGYIDEQGNSLKPFLLPTIDNITNWVTDHE